CARSGVRYYGSYAMDYW
nr:immunoglobulin heavy chain junction region [Mus musculus]